jgi:tetratricopeptide (TPR) repeat protein
MPEELTLAPTLPAEDTGSSHALASFRAMAHPFVVHYSPLLGGTLLLSRDLAGAAGDDAALLARRALALRAAFPGISLALAAGHGMRSQQALAGQVLGAAAELLACTTGDEITLDEVTADLLAPRFVISAGAREGAAPPLRRLIGERDTPAMRTVLGRETPFVGRSHELGVVVATFAAMTLDPRGTLLLITAEPGLGKSRLVHESLVAIRAQHRGAFVLAAHGTPLGETTALGAIARLVRRIGAGGPGSAHDPDGAAEERPLAARIAERLRRVLPADEVAATTDALVALAAVLADEGRALAHVADAAKLAWLRWLAAECAVQPVILALDDLHCWDLPSVQFVQAALEQAGEAPLFVLAAGRPEGRERAPRMYALAGAVHLELSPLFARASERLVREFLPTSDGEVVRAIARRSQGNAYFLEELIRAAVAGERGEAPPGVLATVQARLGRLGEADRRLLRAASVFGPAFADAGVSAVAHVPVAEVRPRLAAFESQELIIRSLAAGGAAHRTYNFRHALTHEAAYATLTDDDRARGHLAAAEWLESQPAHDEAAIAGHFQRGKANARARRWYLKAAERAVGLGNFPEATRSADRCVELGATGLELGLARLAQAEVSAWSGTLAGGFERAREASELLPVGTAPYFRALALCLQIATLHRDLTDLRARVREALFVEPAAGGESGWIRYMCEAAYAAVIVGHTGESAAIMARLGRVTARQVLPDASVAAILRTRGVMHLYAFEFEEAIEAGRQATDCFEAVGNLRGACWARLGVAQTLQFVGAYAEAERIMRAVGGLADKLDASLLQIYQLTRLGTLCLQTGRQDEALACFQRALAISVACGNSRGVGNSRTALAWYWLERGDPEQAEPLARSAADELGLQRAFVRASQGFLARTLLAQGRIEEADAVADAVERDLFAGVVDFEAEHLQTLVAVRGAAHGELAGRRALQRAVDHLARRHASLRDPELRRGYAAQRPIRELLALAARRGLPGASW